MEGTAGESNATGVAPPAGGEQLNIKVKAQDGTEIFFKIKKSTQLKKLMDAYCQRQGFSNNQCRFIFDGERIKDDDTPETLEMENGDEIDVMVEQTGGYFWTEKRCFVKRNDMSVNYDRFIGLEND